ncbi:protein-tyrosine-phosphatase [Xanthocytophaga agilis]|uniref:Protein-tyrosine-phosphatase n=1 Tax=Xanthocytophaga agilis TaxID=3048010 RepID=A0AAE3R484_9BACT|nr:protein-tyrosine-phosphatase [Xanthocytophaga agilis]MDJ1503444.1 protein-tyrosine-phosphatase [Xanthocytophaga agilis]
MTLDTSVSTLFPALQSYADSLPEEFSTISAERKETLTLLVNFIVENTKASQGVNLNFICTHNSRRSQFGQVWARVAAAYYGISGIQTFSGGTEATAFNYRAVESLKHTGFQITDDQHATNPLYSVRYSEKEPVLQMFSKVYDDKANPESNFAAIMVCGQADEACPFIPGADKRISLPYTDPKNGDGTAQEAQGYNAASRLIAKELFWVFAEVKAQLA